MAIEINRRGFLKQASLSMVALGLTAAAGPDLTAKRFTGGQAAGLQGQLLDLVNRERVQAGLNALRLDGLAADVAQLHAIEMAQHNFLSHWGLDGRKPYHRYAFAGGTDATAENDSATDHSVPIASDEIAGDAIRMHKSMHAEVPPDDGHRRTILLPQNTHVGFGIAVRGLHVRLCEVYVSRYVVIDPYPLIKRPQSRFFFSGRVLDPIFTVEGVDVYYEPRPSPPAMSWLQIPRSYSLPENPESLSPRLPANTFYDDGSAGTIEFPSRGRFRVPIDLSRKQPGIYTLVVWLQRGEKAEPFPATHVCVRAE